MAKSIRTSSKITGSASNIYNLIEDAINKYSNEENNGEHPGIGVALDEITNILNGNDYNVEKHKVNLSSATLQKHIYNPAKKYTLKEVKGDIGLTFVSHYLNRLCQYVHNSTFEDKYGKFRGTLVDVKQGIEELSAQNQAFLLDLKRLGITGTVNKLSSSRFEPKQCIEETKHTLFFMGILGSKWVKEKKLFYNFFTKSSIKKW